MEKKYHHILTVFGLKLKWKNLDVCNAVIAV